MYIHCEFPEKKKKRSLLFVWTSQHLKVAPTPKSTPWGQPLVGSNFNTLLSSPKLCHLILGHVASRKAKVCFSACLIRGEGLGQEVTVEPGPR